VQVLDPPRAISWEPGMDTGDSNPQIVGHIWRYDLTPAGPSGTKTTLSYHWSAVPDSLGPPENPILLQRAVQVVAEAGVTLEEIIQRAGLPEDDIHTILGHIHDPRPRVEL
jgi:hypothetical protein